MTIDCEHLAWAVAAGALLVTAMVMTIRTRRSWRWRLAAITLPMLAAACAALALAGVSYSSQSRATAPVVILLDLSDSTRTAPWRDPQWLRTLAQSRLGPRRPVTIVGFDSQPRLLLDHITPGDVWPMEWELAAGTHAQSDLEAALAWRSESERAAAKTSTGSTPIPRWILTDGLLTSPKSDPNRLPLYPLALTLVPPGELDFSVHDIAVHAGEQPGTMEVMAQIRVAGPMPPTRVTTSAPASIRAVVAFECDGQVVHTEAAEFTPLPGQTSIDAIGWVNLHQALPPEQRERSHTYQVKIIDPKSDPWPENNTATYLWHPPNERRTLVLSNQRDPAALTDLHATQIISPTEFSPTAGQLAAGAWQVIILDNIPATTRGNEATSPPMLTPAAAKALDHYVRDAGGGLLILGTDHAFAPGFYGEAVPAAQILEGLSPLWSRPHIGSQRHVIFVLDTSASMNEAVADTGQSRFRILAQGVEQAAGLMADSDRLTVIGFNATATTLIDGIAATTRRGLHDRLARVSPAGATVLNSALVPLGAALQTDKAGGAETLVVLVTDGEIANVDAARWKAVLSGTADRPNAPRLAIVAPPFTSGAPIALEALGASAEKVIWSKTTDPHRWPLVLETILGNEVEGKLRGDAIPWSTASAPGVAPLTGTAELWSDVWQKPESILWAQGGRDQSTAKPLAAIAQRGLGTVAAVAFSGDPPSYGTLITALAAKVASSPGDRRFTFSAKRDDEGHWLLTADAGALPPAKGFLDHEKIQARIFTPSSDDGKIVAFEQAGPGHYEVHTKFSGAISAIFFHPVASTPAGRPTAAPTPPLGQLQTPAVESTEWPASVDHKLLAGDISSAQILSPSTADAFIWNPPLTHTFALAPIFWLISIFAALLALWARR